jgi:hypothetical protein
MTQNMLLTEKSDMDQIAAFAKRHNYDIDAIVRALQQASAE